ncbi:hypothetical protein Waukesha92_15 [Bacillus phage Waukesha92]|uniref:Uncharacterized protein n=1 Tax=Bacillus phage Waukesha92 TaxID=1510440 RepID=A0A068EPV8_9CAUD|nr:hypothetical protein Waukesha92_15 [Bacillus phage Waukesha92]AID50204.1 hypothetical protein Waukesha92_15 [Bacillus phage Waukesha92]
MAQHCLNCGNKLETVNYVETCTKYICSTCNVHWFQSRRVVVEWTKQKIKADNTK